MQHWVMKRGSVQQAQRRSTKHVEERSVMCSTRKHTVEWCNPAQRNAVVHRGAKRRSTAEGHSIVTSRPTAQPEKLQHVM